MAGREPSDPVKIVLDNDAGVDDAVAIVLAMNSPEARLLAITTVAGNAPVEECTRNCLLIAEILNPDDPPVVAEGAASPLERELLTAPEVRLNLSAAAGVAALLADRDARLAPLLSRVRVLQEQAGIAGREV